MNKRPLLVLILFTLLLLSSCGPFLQEQLAADAEVFADEVFQSESDVLNVLNELVPLPKNTKMLYSCMQDNELFLHFKADISIRIAYEQELNSLWYKLLAPIPELNDRISTWLHPSGWRVAIYDNRRNTRLRETYGSDEYVFSVQVKKIEFESSIFPKYPEADKDLFLNEELLGDLDTYPAELLPENFPGLPEHAIFLSAKCLSKGLALTALTTYDDLEAFLENNADVYAPCGSCYADEEGNFFYIEIQSVYVFSEENTDISVPEPPKDPALLEIYEENRVYFTREELPHFEDEGVLDTDFCKISIQVIRAEWVPEWYPRS